MKYFKIKRQVLIIILLAGFLLLFMPFTRDFVFSSSMHTVTSGSDSNAFSINYFQYCYNFIDNLKYPYKFPFLEVVGIFFVLVLPFSILIQIISFVKYKYKLIYIFCLISLLTLIEFGYFNSENLQFGYYLTTLHQFFLFLYFIKNRHARL